MSDSFTKLFSSIIDSTVWAEDDTTRIVWVTMLAMADQRGYVGASVPGLAARARKTVRETVTALKKLMAPDPYSRTKDNEGRRIAEVERGWTLLNYRKFRDARDDDARREYERERKREQRARDVRDMSGTDGDAAGQQGRDEDVPCCLEASAQAEAESSLTLSGSTHQPPDQTRPPVRSNGGAIRAADLAPPRAPYRPIPVGVVTPPFLEVYEAYPRKDARLKAAVVFDELAAEYPGGARQVADEILAAFRAGMLKRHPYAGSNNYRPTLETVLVERRWLDATPAPDNQPRDQGATAYRKL